MDKKFYGLILPKKAEKQQPKSKSIFASSDDDEEDSPVFQKSQNSKSLSSKVSSKHRATQQKLLEDDPTIYEYDSIYDNMKQEQTKKVVSVKKEGPRYISSLLKAAEKRKKEHERRQEKKIQIERDKEGEQYKDKEAFVTSAYKKKMIEMQEEEERERLQDQVDEMMDVTKQKDLSGFYRHYLKQTVGEEAVPDFDSQDIQIRELQARIQTRIKKEDCEEEDSVKPCSSATRETLEPSQLKHSQDLDADSYSSSEDESSGSKETNARNREPSESRIGSDTEGTIEQEGKKSQIKIPSSKKHYYKGKKERKPTNSRSHHQEESNVEKNNQKQSLKHFIDGKVQHSDKSDSDQDHESNAKESTNSKSRKKRSSSSESSDDSCLNKKAKRNKHLSSVSNELNSLSQSEHESEFSSSKIDNVNSESSKNIPETEPKNKMSIKFVKRTVGEIFDRAQARYFERLASRKANRNV